MSEYLFATLSFYYLLFFYKKGVAMGNKFLEKMVNFFCVTGVIANSVWLLMKLLELLTEWFENGTLLRVWEFIRATVLVVAWLFIFWILHKFAMFGLHKLWPDVYDEYGHLKKKNKDVNQSVEK
ncbi:MAG: hypothetical protein IJ587_11610 [Synergistaceae bacterium]|nr:hypothetical protein [Synergistaceae bacterium]